MSVILRLFGPVELTPSHERVSRKGHWVLAILALRRGREVERGWLAGTLWPDNSEAQARYNLRRELTQLRRALGAEARRLRSGAQTLSFDVDGADVDVLAFDGAASAGDPRVLEVYRGPLLADCPEVWALEEREARRRTYLTAVDALARDAMRRGEPELAVRYLRRAVATDPLDESLHRALMRALAAAGSPAAALDAYRDLRARLADDLQVEPAPETRALFHALRRPAPDAAQRVPRPAPPAASSRPTRVPRPVEPLVGRSTHVAEVLQRLADQRLVTLTGSGGVGKSRLAIAVAEAATELFADGVAWVELGALADPALVAPAIAAALDLKELPARPLVDLVRAAVAERELLLVLDDCDPLVATCAVVAEDLLRACARLRILATSRQSLAVPGELVWRVPSLAEADAVALFGARAVPGADTDPALVAHVCRRLDGIPQAIALAAARTRSLTVAQIAERLDDRLRLLAHGGRAGLPRHTTLRATLDWSHQLLAPDEQRLLAELSLFSGSFTLDDAAAVHGGDALDALDRLVDKSLVVFDPRDGRHHLLETVRAYAGERLAACDDAASPPSGAPGLARERFVAHYVALAEAAEPHILCGAGDELWMSRLDAETDNLRAALDVAIDLYPSQAGRLVAALYWYWFERGRLREACSAIDAVLPLCDLPATLPPAVAAKTLAAAGWVALWDRDLNASRPLFERAVARCRALGDQHLVAYALAGLSVPLAVAGNYTAAHEAAGEAERLTRDDGSARALRVFVLGLLARALLLGGDAGASKATLEEALVLARVVGHPTAIGNCLLALGQFAHAAGDHQAAWAALLEGTRFLRPADCCGWSRMLAALGRLAMDEAQVHLGARLLGAAEVLYESTGLTLFVPERPDRGAAEALIAGRGDPRELARGWAEGRLVGAGPALDELMATSSQRARGSCTPRS